jgi:hypothetical protein
VFGNESEGEDDECFFFFSCIFDDVFGVGS